ncbi:hypothetical protein BM221_000963 [Beauveria bassiana]|uniref:Uncharacterized protein n=1 Tax=Beauveria bassiana TaxID=176275 RepID=A0A2N6P212_BEABA|nr:hypothetical protein BM221_000963 [Beauveria bassiana]
MAAAKYLPRQNKEGGASSHPRLLVSSHLNRLALLLAVRAAILIAAFRVAELITIFKMPTSPDQAQDSTSPDQAQDAVVTATELLAYDDAQLALFLKSIKTDNGYDLSSVDGFMEFSKAQKDNFSDKVERALLRIEHQVDELHERLANLADQPHDSTTFEPRHLTTESPSPPPLGVPRKSFEDACYDGLIEAGCRPVCSIQERNHISAEPATRYRPVISWLTDDADTATGADEIRSVFSRQFRQWWFFRKSQWINRGIDESEEELSVHVESYRRRAVDSGNERLTREPDFDYVERAIWKDIPKARQLPDGQPFSAYRAAVEFRLKPYGFKRRLQLRKNPHQQDAWTNWLEYLSFEKWILEHEIDTADSLESEFLSSWRLLAARDMEILSRQHSNAMTGRPDRATKADQDANETAIHNFVQQTKRYKETRAAVFYQRHRVKWAVREARLLESEIAKQAKAAERSRLEKRSETRKRRHEQND